MERLDLENHTWAQFSHFSKKPEEDIEVLQDTFAVQADSSRIVVFGGRNENGFKVDDAFVFQDLGIETLGVPNKRLAEVRSLAEEKRTIFGFAG